MALIPGVAPAGRYPASYPMEPGLSSTGKPAATIWTTSTKLNAGAHLRRDNRAGMPLLLLLQLQDKDPLTVGAGQQLFVFVEVVV